ncbi:response regulator transcription factor [Priestia koreensis]|uniref:PhoP family transcriptional regulator n=1 Tax=Priestia koreensis TaxID=284581 RepID=A0A0M0KEF3_9BACI|nr:response regulator transcription factor [Priestia koreensis]KOO37226.1 PhoP family transcriptional regulator [Priestia koreensis]MCM3004604.1 response regulator transcription factor [Priestia koreensis]
MSPTILVVDDEKEIVELIELYLTQSDFQIMKAYNGKEALTIIQNQHIDLLIADIMMPELNGYQLIQKVREHHHIPILIISAKNESYDKILGLNIGADDYITKPFDPLELVARVQSQLRRSTELNHFKALDTDLKIGPLTLNTVSCTLFVHEEEVMLTSTEYRLLKLFMEHPNQVFTKRHLFERIWREDYMGDDNTIMVHISKLRDKIEQDSRNPYYLKTIRGLGYTFKVNHEV